MSRERELLRRLDEWYVGPPDRSSYEQLSALVADARALLAEPEGENDLTIRVPDAFSRLPLEQWVEFTAKLYRNADGTLLMDGESVTSTPRSRAEAEAMLKRYDESVVALQEGPMEALVPDAAEFDDARAALLAALTTEGM